MSFPHPPSEGHRCCKNTRVIWMVTLHLIMVAIPNQHVTLPYNSYTNGPPSSPLHVAATPGTLKHIWRSGLFRPDTSRYLPQSLSPVKTASTRILDSDWLNLDQWQSQMWMFSHRTQGFRNIFLSWTSVWIPRCSLMTGGLKLLGRLGRNRGCRV